MATALMGWREWTEEDDQLALREDLSAGEKAARLGRTAGAVRQRAANLRKQQRQVMPTNGNHGAQELPLSPTEPADPSLELVALRDVYRAVCRLDPAARQRVLSHVEIWFEE